MIARPRAALASLLTLAFLAGCEAAPTPIAAPTPTPTATPTPSLVIGTSFDVTPCLLQTAVPGRTVTNLVVPDVLNLDLTQPAAFPNGRRYLDPVIDVTLAAIFLDLRRHPADTLAKIPVNPNGIDQPLPTTFPFLAPPFGTHPPADAGRNFTFRTDPVSAYVRVDRAGMPGVSTALITGNVNKNLYNDDTPLIDASGKWVNEISGSFVFLTNALYDDFIRLGLTPCARPTS